MILPHIEFPELPPVNRREVLRYAGSKAETPELTVLLDEAMAELLPSLAGKVCWTEFPVIWQPDSLDLGFAATHSAALRQNLLGCDRILVFAATIGLGPDRLINRYSRISPVKALLVQALGAERIEALCDCFCHQWQQNRGCFLSPRFSPGYGDLPLTLQSDLFQVLDCPRTIGLTLNSSLLMSPAKSVTAIAGLRTCAGDNTLIPCSRCGKHDCAYRRMP